MRLVMLCIGLALIFRGFDWLIFDLEWVSATMALAAGAALSLSILNPSKRWLRIIRWVLWGTAIAAAFVAMFRLLRNVPPA